MKTSIVFPFIFLSFFYTNAYSEFKAHIPFDLLNFSNVNNDKEFTDKAEFITGPAEQRISLSFGGNVTFQLSDLDGCQSVRIEAKAIGLGSWQTIQGFEDITSKGNYTKTIQQIFQILGIGVFFWRVADNNSFNHVGHSNLLVILG